MWKEWTIDILLLQTADYSFTKNNPNWDLVLDIKIDIGGGEEVNILYIASKNKIIVKNFP